MSSRLIDILCDSRPIPLRENAHILGSMKDKTHILIVDDHREIRELVGKILIKDGFHISTAADGREMQQVLRNSQVDLIVLDLMLRLEDGLTLCRELRSGPTNIPIIILTAKGDEIDRVLGLEMGADDYVAKPFSSRELVARIKAVLRRARSLPSSGGGASPKIYRFGKWVLDTAKREIESDEIVVPLSTGEFNLLLAFVEHPQHVLSRDQLLDLAKGRFATSLDRSIDLQVSRLRRKIERDAKNPEVIKTVWGDGYLFTPHVMRE